jgi:protoheme IX farnesyltransferase
MVIISAAVACLMTAGPLKVAVLLHTVLGTGLLAAGASTLNQYLERALDGRMRRTSRRPLPSGQLTAGAALVFGLSLSVAGAIDLFLFLNALTGLLGLFTLFSYLFVYTPLKRKTTLCTLVGAIPGAAPVLIGWAAANNSLALEAWVLFAILFFWQFPHFYAIGWFYREDYARAGMLMIPAVDTDDGAKTFRLILISTQVLIVATLLLIFVAPTSTFYFLLASILGLSFYIGAYRAYVTRTKLAAKRLLHASVIYLGLLYVVMALDRLILQT